MNLLTLRDLIRDVKWRVAFNEGQTDLEFAGPAEDPNRWFRQVINEAYVDEVEEATQRGDPTWFYQRTTISWPAAQKDLQLPAGLEHKELIKIADITDSDPGTPLWFNDWEEGGGYFWVERDTMAWPPSGPGSTRTLAITFVGEPEELVNDEDAPVLMPPKFRHLISWTAAIKLRTIADDMVPQQWERERDDIRARFLKFIYSRGPAQTGSPGIRNPDPDYGSYR